MRIISGKAKGTKLYTLQGDNTRPTLDRVKESIFNIIQSQIPEATVLDLFAGSGALALEALSRGAKEAVLCEISKEAVAVIQKNIEKTHMQEKAKLMLKDFIDAIEDIARLKKTFDIIFLDPPYKTCYDLIAIKSIIEKNLLTQDGIIIVETDEEEKIELIQKIENITVQDIRRYGRVKLVFLKVAKGVK